MCGVLARNAENCREVFGSELFESDKADTCHRIPGLKFRPKARWEATLNNFRVNSKVDEKATSDKPADFRNAHAVETLATAAYDGTAECTKNPARDSDGPTFFG